MSDNLMLNLSTTSGEKSNYISAKTKRGSFYGKQSVRHVNKKLRKEPFSKTRTYINSSSSTLRANDEYSSGLNFGDVKVDSRMPEKSQDPPKKFISGSVRSKKHRNTEKDGNDDTLPNNYSVTSSYKRYGTGKSNVIKSSLFNNNPDIPGVVQPSINKIIESTFSERNFSDFDLHERLSDYLMNKMNHKTATTIQKKTIPVLLNGSDALVKSQTGSGKTLAYAVPLIQNLQSIKPEVSRLNGPLALVLVPTRELASQTYEIVNKLTLPFRRIVATWIMGGEKRKSEKARIRKGVNIVVGTPGRILDHVTSTECFSLKNVKWLICDEADRLLDMGFESQIKDIIKALNENREDGKNWQSVLLSATLPHKVESLAKVTLNDPVRVQLNEEGDDAEDDNFAIPDNLLQHITVVPSKLRLVSLMMFLRWKIKLSPSKILIFVSCRDSVVFHYEITKFLITQGIIKQKSSTCRVFKLHGGMLQGNRQKVFSEFQSSTSGVLFCTDVAARGLHLPNIDWVVQYTCPCNPVDYIHRVGRTARAGEKGEALLMLLPSEMKYLNLLTQYNIPINEVSLDILLNGGKTPENGAESQHAKEEANRLQNQIEEFIEDNEKLLLQAKLAYGSFIRSYSSYPSHLKSIFHVKHLHLGHVTKSFGLNQTPKEIISSLQKSVKYLQMNNTGKTNKKGNTAKDVIESIQRSHDVNEMHKEYAIDAPSTANIVAIRKRRQVSNKLNVMSEFGSGLEVKKAKLATE